jgi:hypothetical protein
MYFKLGPSVKDDKFSWIISKHPQSEFERLLGNGDGRKVCGKFDADGHFYEGSVQNDVLVFLETARKLNMSNYVHTQLGAVCPHNLKGFATIFSSVMKGAVPGGGVITEDAFFKPLIFEGVIGPFPCYAGQVVRAFKAVGIDAEPIESDGTSRSFMFQIKTDAPVSATEFFQKVYIISYFLTVRYTLVKISDAQIEKFVDLSKGWLETSPLRNAIVNTLSRRDKGLIKKFELGLLEGDDETESAPKIEKIEEFLNRVGLHQKRHNYIIEKIDDSCKTLIDLGSSEGKLLSAISKCKPNVRILGIEANPYKVQVASVRVKSKNVKVINSNILFPMIRESHLLPDFLTAIEVIEHLEKNERRELLQLIKQVLVPRQFIITTPNFDFNKNYGMREGEYRHKDHRIEYTFDQLEAEVLDYMSSDYDITIGKLFPEGEDEPSFIVQGVHKDPDSRKADIRQFMRIQNMYAPLYLEDSGYTVAATELSNGYASLPFLLNNREIFYLAPTMSPVDYNRDFPDFLEHPSTCFSYYRDRGIKELVGEEKYMGSRGCLLAFKELSHARSFGFKLPIVVNSRSGFPFFDDLALKALIYEDLVSKMQSDFIILDCEVLPWLFKAKGLIEKEFLIPGECSYLSRKYGKYGSVKNCEDYLQVLSHYSSEQPLEIRPFHVLAEGNIKVKKTRNVFSDVKLGLMFDHVYHMERTAALAEGVFKPVNWHLVNLDVPNSCATSVELWERFCENGGEGFVYKPLKFLNYTSSGYPIQPALKVRGRKYLQIIYGIDYRDPDYFNKVCRRGTAMKRKQAVQEAELGMKLLKAFLNCSANAQAKFVAAFIGMESVSFSGVDATL